MTKMLIDRQVVEHALHVAMVAEHPVKLIAALRAALAEPVQEPDSPERRCGGPGCDGACCQPVQEPQGCDHCNHPLYAATKCRVCGRVTEPTPPQRKPLTEEQIDHAANNILTDDPVQWWRKLARAVERAHGIGGEE